MQPDFMPGGALAVEGGDELVGPVGALMASGRFPLQVATQDWHPPGHVSFASVHPGRKPFETVDLYGRPQMLWPDHCVQGSPGAALHRGLPWAAVSAVIRKGADASVDSYSGFKNNWNRDGRRPATGLGGYLRDRGVRTVFLCGLARDYCVLWSAEDAVEMGFEVFVLWDLTRPVDPASDDAVRASMERVGVRVASAAQLG